MSLASNALQRGMLSLQVSAGEAVTFRAASVVAIVNLAPKLESASDPGVDFSVQSQSEVQFLTADLSSPPRPGEYITTADARRHRIMSVRFVGTGWIARCEVS